MYSIFPLFLSNVCFKISSHCKVLRNDHLCSGSWLLMLVSVVAAPLPSLNMTWHETLQCRGRGHVHRRQPYGLCSWTWGSRRRSLQTSERWKVSRGGTSAVLKWQNQEWYRSNICAYAYTYTLVIHFSFCMHPSDRSNSTLLSTTNPFRCKTRGFHNRCLSCAQVLQVLHLKEVFFSAVELKETCSAPVQVQVQRFEYHLQRAQGSQWHLEPKIQRTQGLRHVGPRWH